MKSKVEILDDRIASLKIKKKQDLSLLNLEINSITESLKPINILKTAKTEVIGFVKAEGNILNKMIELGVGEIGKKATSLVGDNRVGRFLGRLFKYFN
jgi:hypothetical protein